ncbi:MAG TPA: molybdopterin-dependent oxidoreductase [Usitatibacter sp.]|jgi:biotin/methionine sulfoxide reductase|nr:molybdopterin-dependent oxidoreductase [Usitatibacter sp.]
MRPSAARFPQLAHWGAFTAVVEQGRVVRCEPFARDPCPSPILDSIPGAVYSERRIRRPAVRRSWLDQRERSDGTRRGREDFVDVDWEVALGLVAGEIERVRDAYGPQSIFAGSYGWSSAGRLHHARSLVRRFYFANGGCIDQVGNYSWGSAQFLLPHVIGTYAPLTGRVTSWPSILAHTRVFLAFGGLALKNGQVSSGGAAEHTQEGWLRDLAARGIPVINVSPTRDDCPAFLNAEWIPIRPNTDVAFMLALAHEVIRMGAHDRTFLARYCVGFEALERYIGGAEDGTPKSPQWAEGITGVPAATIAALARRLTGVRSYITCSFAVQRAQHGEQPYWMAIALASILGQVGLPGGGFGFGHGSMNGVGNPRPATPGPAMPVGRNPIGRAIPVARIADMLLAPGSAYRFDGGTYEYPDIRFVHWAGGNPFHHHQELHRFERAWAKPETIVVNEIWWTPAALRADIVLPATTSLERNDIGGSSRDRYVLAMHRAIEPLHEARADFDIFADLAERLGTREAFTEERDEMAWIREIYARCAAAHAKAGIAFPGFERFWQEGHVELPSAEDDFVLFADFRADPAANPLATPSGRIELYSEKIASFGYEDCGPHPRWSPPDEWLGATAASTHPLHLVSVQPVARLHSQLDFGTASLARKIGGRERVTLNTGDARQRGLDGGETVRVYNDRGACLAGLATSEHVMPGVAVMETGAWFAPRDGAPEDAGTANVLTRDVGTSQLTQGPNAMSCLVQVARWTEAAE